jgi:phosphate-selective porin OprO/OprP
MLRNPPFFRSPLALVLLVAFVGPTPVSAQADADGETEVAALRADLARIQARLDALEAKGSATSPAPVPTPAATPAPTVDAGPGLEVASADASSTFELGGRVHYDVYAHDTDRLPATGGSEFRRVRVNAEGSAGGWSYVVQAELSGRNTDLRNVYLSRGFGAGNTVLIGQFKPFRSLDELVSSNDLSVMERGFGSASGLFADRQWQQGVGILSQRSSGTLGFSAFSLREDNTPRNEGWGMAARGTWLPFGEGEHLVHLGASHSIDNGGRDTPGVAVEVAYGGRRGPEALLFESAVGGAFEQRSSGLEFAGRVGGLHWQSEWQRATIAGAAGEGRFETRYAQLGYLFGGTRAYDASEGVFDSPEEVGDGLWELVARIDRITRRDVQGVDATRLVLGANWYVGDDLRFMLNWTRGEDRATGDEPSQLALRAQYVF